MVFGFRIILCQFIYYQLATFCLLRFFEKATIKKYNFRNDNCHSKRRFTSFIHSEKKNETKNLSSSYSLFQFTFFQIQNINVYHQIVGQNFCSTSRQRLSVKIILRKQYVLVKRRTLFLIFLILILFSRLLSFDLQIPIRTCKTFHLTLST